MKFRDILEAVFPKIARNGSGNSAVSRMMESWSQAEGGERGFDPDRVSRWEWRKISNDLGSGDDLDHDAHLAILRRAYSAWCKNPLAGQIVNLTTWFVMGKGVGFTAHDPSVQDILSDFWNDPDNNMHIAQHWMSNELQIYGEIFIRLFINPIDGTVKLVLVDPSEIHGIVTDPDDMRKPVAFLREYKNPGVPEEWINAFRDSGSTPWIPPADDVVREIIPGDEIIHVKVNNVSNRKRGISELYRILPWLDAYDRWLGDRLDINRARGTFAFLRKVPAVPEKASGPFETDSSGKYIVPKSGSILVVHEDEDWEVLSPSIGADDAKEDGRALKLMIAAGSGIFEHYFGDPSTGNLATTRSMELPMVKKFEDRQRLFEGVFGKLFKVVIESGISSGVLPPGVDKSVEVSFPPIVPDDVKMLTDILIDQVEAGLLSKDSARRMIPWIGNPSKEAQAVDEEKY